MSSKYFHGSVWDTQSRQEKAYVNGIARRQKSDREKVRLYMESLEKARAKLALSRINNIEL